VAQVIECLPNKHKALSSKCNTAKRRKDGRKERRKNMLITQKSDIMKYTVGKKCAASLPPSPDCYCQQFSPFC
jgi:hypothetical protein